ncbi:MAG TPA: VanZ family protein [Syntrophales bacterium]|nr:VanZ family protein [Syntrophales bacterium]HPI57862.1 VanZ family protein [Syntrophales bacterium]HPN24520.1 VanZ family protein [Syntrophales bacterium]HQM28826.1 VanZ family protein [Syntrophales bacterium]
MKKRFVRYHLPAVVFATLIFALSSLSKTPEILSEVVGADKLLHALEYFIFGYLIMRVFATSPGRFIRRWAVLLALVAGTAYAASDEFHQSFVPGRTASLYDVLFDTLGVLLAAALYRPMRFRVGLLKAFEDHLEWEAES